MPACTTRLHRPLLRRLSTCRGRTSRRSRWGDGMDYALVQRLRGQVADKLRAERRGRAERGDALLSGDEERELGRALILEALTDYRRAQLLGSDANLPPAE